VTQEFHLSVRLPATGVASEMTTAAVRGTSLATSVDGTVMVAVLGNDRADHVAAELAQAYLDNARDPMKCRVEDVAAVVVDRSQRSVTVVAAPIGLRQVFWATVDGELSVGSHPRQLGCFAGRIPAIRPEALFQYLYFHMLPGPVGVFAGVSKLEGGHRLYWDGQSVQVERYWRPRFEDVAQIDETDACRQLHDLLRAAVHRELGRAERVGAFLSGGLDSSTVAGMAAGIQAGVRTVSMGFDAQGYDEMEFARLAARRFGTTPLEYYVTPEDVLATLPTIAAAFPEPFGNSSAAAAYHCARIAREQGLSLLLAGDGGDELFGGNERYAKQLVFERYAKVPLALRKGALEPLVGALGRATQVFPIGKAVSYIEQANVPLPDRLQTYNFLHRHDPAEIFSDELLAAVDRAAPLRMLREEYTTPDTTSAVNRMLFLDWKFTLHDNDLVKVNTMCQLAGVDVAYPMLDQSVVDFSLRIPGDWKVRDGELRWFYKRAMQGFLPDQIIHKTKHGFGLPFGVWTRTHKGLRRLSEDALATLSERSFFRPEFLREALRLHSEGHASYYGELVWLLTVLELWLRAHAPRAAYG
jgi:asparagine synthase (glutamine-hydrolysing)